MSCQTYPDQVALSQCRINNSQIGDGDVCFLQMHPDDHQIAESAAQNHWSRLGFEPASTFPAYLSRSDQLHEPCLSVRDSTTQGRSPFVVSSPHYTPLHLVYKTSKALSSLSEHEERFALPSQVDEPNQPLQADDSSFSLIQ